jgi:hypothetical protein
MKKISLIALLTSSVIAFNASAQDSEGKNNIASFRAQVIASLNKEKAIIDTEISCMNSVSTTEDFAQCRATKKAAMNVLRAERQSMSAQRLESRKENLEKKMSKINEKTTTAPASAVKK